MLFFIIIKYNLYWTIKKEKIMDPMNILIFLAIGAVAGWLAQLIMGGNNNLLTNVVVGVAGSFLGAYLFNYFGISLASGLLGVILTAVVGAIVLILVLRILRSIF